MAILMAAVACPAAIRTAGAATIRIQCVIDGVSELVVSPKGLYWNHVSCAKPGNHGRDYELAGPTCINGHPWTPSWSTPPADRVADVSDVYPITIKAVRTVRRIRQYDHRFDEYPEYRGQWQTLGDELQINRGNFSITTHDGHPAIQIDDAPFDGQNVYCFEINVEMLDAADVQRLVRLIKRFAGQCGKWVHAHRGA